MSILVQRKHLWTNVRLVLIPLFLCSVLLGIQLLIDHAEKETSALNKCGSKDAEIGGNCPVPKPPLLPPMLQIPEPDSRAVQAGFFSYGDLPDKSCRKTGTCPVTILLTGNNISFGKGTCFSIMLITFFDIYC